MPSSTCGKEAPTGGTQPVPRYRKPHVVLFSRNVERAVSFYARLGFVETFRTPSSRPTHIELELDGYMIGIATTRAADGAGAAVTVWTDDAFAAFADLTASGAPAVVPPCEWPGGLVIAWVADPDGNAIQIAQAV